MKKYLNTLLAGLVAVLAVATPVSAVILGKDFIRFNNTVTLTADQALNNTSATTITAGTTQTQAGGTLLAAGFNNVTTVGTTSDGVRLPTAAAGKVVVVKNSGANVLRVWPFLGDAINAMAVNLSVDLPVNGTLAFRAKDATTWETDEKLTLQAPSTQKGSLVIDATDSTGNTVTRITNAAQAQASVITFPDLGAAWNVVGTESAQTVNGVKTFGSPIVYKSATGITAFATGGQASATALAAEWNNVTTCATAADSVKLPAAVLGQVITVQNNGAAALAVFPASGDAIDALSANASVTVPVGATATFRAIDGTTWYANTQANINGVKAAGGFTLSPRCIHTGAQGITQSTDGTEVTITNTVMNVAELQVPANCTITGAAVFWGATTDGNAKVALYDSTGTRVALSASTDISGYTGDSYGSRIAFSSAYSAKGPATYYLGVICDTNTNTINTHILGNFGAGEITALVYATEAGYATITPPTTFTTGKGPIATLY